jgi:uncharacterized membrane-anchored protein
MKSIVAAVLAALLCLCVFQARAQGEVSSLPWQTGKAVGDIAGKATFQIPEGYAFLGAKGTRELNAMMHNPQGSEDIYTLAPLDMSWVAFFNYSNTGYVKDNDKLDADDLLASVREGTEAANRERKEKGWDPMHVTGWRFQPKYDKAINTLEWAIIGENETTHEQSVNYNTRLLGRHGVMEVVVVASPEDFDTAIADFKRTLPGYQYVAGERYAEFREGDHVAEYGLAALVTGGAAAVAAKKGLFGALGAFLASMWKLLVAGAIAAAAWLRKLFGGKSKADKQKTIQ